MGTPEETGYWQRRLGRRRAMQGAAVGGAGLAAIAIGCSSNNNQKAANKPASNSAGSVVAAASPAAKQPKRGGTLIHAGGDVVGSWDISSTTLDPHINSAPGAVGFRLMYQGLLGYDPRTYAVQAETAQKWELPDQTTYVFHLQPGIKWQNKPPVNGRLLTAQDVAFSLNRAQTPQPQFQHRALFATVDKIEPVDNATLRVTTKVPDAAMLSKLSADGLLILAPEVIQKYDKLTTADAVVGTGPFIMKSVQEKVAGEYVRNPDYWKQGFPYLDGLRTQQVENEQAGYSAFQSGQLDISRLNGSLTKDYIAKQGPGFQPEWFKDVTMIFATPNTKAKPMDDARVTRALRLLIDHEEMKTAWAEVWFGRGRPGSIFGTGLDSWDLTEQEYAQKIFWKAPKDDAVKEALQLLSAAGYSKDSPLSFELLGHTGSFQEPANQLLQAQWKRLSQNIVNTNIKQVDLGQALQIQAAETFTYGLWGLAGASAEPDSWLSLLYVSNGSRNRMQISDPKLDAMINQQRGEFDQTKRKAIVKDLINYMADNSPGTLISNRYFLEAVKPKVQDYAPEFYISGRQYEWIWLNS